MTRRILFVAAALALASLAISAQSAAPIYDVVIRNGLVLDGAGNPAIRADVAIDAGHFVKIGIIPGKGQREIDAGGHYVSPGWIDMMDQSGATLRANGLAENKLREGVTTAIGGEGGTPVPGRSSVRGSASTSAATSARRRRVSRSSATTTARRQQTSSPASSASWSRRCRAARWA